MCGIFGIIRSKESTLSETLVKKIATDLFLLSASRGKEASGFALYSNEQITIYKTPDHPKDLISSAGYKKIISEKNLANVRAVIGHSRMVTNGTEYSNVNNQPFVKNNIAGIHNGIIVNEADIWKKYSGEERISDLDSEVIPTIIRHGLNNGSNLSQALELLYKEIYGMASIALMFADFENIVLATNNGSLYFNVSKSGNEIVFASENFIHRELIHKSNIQNLFAEETIRKIQPNEFCCISLNNLSRELKTADEISKGHSFSNTQTRTALNIIDESPSGRDYKASITPYHLPASFEQHYQRCKDRISKLKRCTKCLLPETFPNIVYDAAGVCSYCNNYKPFVPNAESELIKIADSVKKNNNRPDCLVAFSGGRDSSYSLHYLKNLGLNPLAFSYDWGMITDLARRNQSRICAELGIEHILVSADIRKKRRNVRLNVSAWLNKPSLGTIPLFMAGDKQYFYYADVIKKQNGLDTTFMGENHLEKTGFKTAFSGAKQEDAGFMAYHISTANNMRMVSFYMKEYLTNPAYINQSLLDTAGAFFSYYGLKHDYINIFDYLKWDETTISKTIIDEYDWELSPDTASTWRIGDGTAPFYNYIYYVVTGFTENDTFRSNQIREGSLTREEALALSLRDNYPRWESIKWYCDTIHIDFQKAIEIINKIPTLFSTK